MTTNRRGGMVRWSREKTQIAITGLLIAAGCVPPRAPVVAVAAGPSVTEVPVSVPTYTMPPAPADPEPDAAASDAAGTARLMQLAWIWHLASLHHPAVAVRGAPLDSAFIRAVTLVRRADTPEALALAYERFLGALQDPLSRVERVDGGPSSSSPSGSGSLTQVSSVNVERSADSILVLQLPTASVYAEAATVGIRDALTSVPRRVVLDLRSTAGTTIVDSVEAFVARTQLVERLASVPFTESSVRVRRVGGARFVADHWQFDDAWVLRDGRLILPQDTASKRVVVLANVHTVLPRGVLGLIASGRATLVAEGGLRDDALVPSITVPLRDGLQVRLRTGELLHADGSSDLRADTVVSVSAISTPLDSNPAMRTAFGMLRTQRFLRASRLPVVRAPASLPGYYDRDPYPFMGARVLAGARLWSLTRGRHAHRDLYDDDADAVFERALPRLESARTAVEYATTLRSFVGAFDDAQVRLEGASMDSVRGIAALPFRVRWVDGRAVISDLVRDSVTRALALEAGQEVTAVDGYPMPSWMIDHQRDVSAPNEWTRQRLLMEQLPFGAPGNSLMRVRDVSGRERQLAVPRTREYVALLAQVERPNQPAAIALTGGVSYLDVNRLTDQTVDDAIARHRGARAWIVDLRGALADSSLVGERVLQALRARPVAVSAVELHRYQSAPCLAPTLREATAQCPDERETRARVIRGDTARHYAGRVVALVDERTSGAMERLALAIEAATEVTFIGSASSGSAADAVDVSLPGNLTVQLPAMELRRIDQSQWQRIGITPVVDARLTLRGVRSGVDDVIERAQQWLVQQLDGSPRRRR
ncbi:MAG: hypothetical protein IBJ03_01545 [Gemmatimonadaceae bacterium]|nr:hypothetical protein [Gemmatimonadaceae bacterium]